MFNNVWKKQKKQERCELKTCLCFLMSLEFYDTIGFKLLLCAADFVK